MIFDQISDSKDLINFMSTCRRINNVYFRLDTIMDAPDCMLDVNKTFRDLEWEVDVDDDIVNLTTSRPTLKNTSLVIECGEVLHWKVFHTIPTEFAASIVHLEIKHEDPQFLSEPDAFIHKPVELPSLENLTMSLNLFLQLNGRVIDITTKKLKSITLNICSGLTVTIQDAADFLKMLKRQRSLRVLTFVGDFRLLFDKPLKLSTKLHSITLGCHNEDLVTILSEEQQDNLADFLMSQPKCANSHECKFHFWAPVLTEKLRVFKKKYLDSDCFTLKMSIDNGNFAHDCYNSQELSADGQEQNEVTRNLEVEIVDDAILSMEFIGFKFPLLVILKIQLKLENIEPIDLSGLSTLDNLSTLELEYHPTCVVSESLMDDDNSEELNFISDDIFCDVKLTNLKKFVFIDHSDADGCTKHLKEIEVFISKNRRLEDLTVTFPEDAQRDKTLRSVQFQFINIAMLKLLNLMFFETTWIIPRDNRANDIAQIADQVFLARDFICTVYESVMVFTHAKPVKHVIMKRMIE